MVEPYIICLNSNDLKSSNVTKWQRGLTFSFEFGEIPIQKVKMSNVERDKRLFFLPPGTSESVPFPRNRERQRRPRAQHACKRPAITVEQAPAAYRCPGACPTFACFPRSRGSPSPRHRDRSWLGHLMFGIIIVSNGNAAGRWRLRRLQSFGCWRTLC